MNFDDSYYGQNVSYSSLDQGFVCGYNMRDKMLKYAEICAENMKYTEIFR